MTMNNLISALQFTTILPVGGEKIFRPRGMIQCFPLVGIIIGAMLSAVDQMSAHLWSGSVASLVDVIFLVCVTGAFHLDGLGDTADGLFSHRGKTEALRIMKDSRVGAMGLVAIVTVLAAKWAGIAGMHSADRGLLLVLIPAYARAGMLFGMRMLPYGRAEGGTGKPFFDDPLEAKSFWGVLIPVGLSVFLGWTGLALNLFFALNTAGMILFYKRQMACITGDMLGAMTETGEAIMFLTISMGIFQ